MTYIDPDLVSDETSVAEFILGELADAIPGWEPTEGSPETSMGEALAVVSATIAALIKDEERNNYAGFGELVLGLARGAAGVASGLATWTLSSNDQGYTIPAGTEAVWDSPTTGDPVAFATTGDYFMAAGQLVAVGVPMTALEPGTDSDGAVGDATEFDELDIGVASVSMPIETAGGSEPEAIEDYVARVADRARRVRAIPVTADDFAATALDVPEVDRAVAVNLLDLDNPPAGSDPPSSVGHLTIYPIDAAGQPITGPALAALNAIYSTADRPLGVTVHIGTPTYTDLAVAVSVRLVADADEAAVLAAVEAAVADFLNPATWNVNDATGGRWRPPVRDVDRPVREYDISDVVSDVEGVAGVVLVTINGTDVVNLPGYAPLPRLTSVEATAA